MHLFVPVIYKTEGAILAGQVGMMLSVIKSLTNISNTWLDSKLPKLNSLAKVRDKNAFDFLFYRCAKLGYIFFFVNALILVSIVFVLTEFDLLADRLIPVGILSLFLLSELAFVKVGFMAKYLRAHMEEPFYMVSLFSAIGISLITFLVTPTFGVFTLSIAVLVFHWIFILPYGLKVFRNSILRFYPPNTN
ncbi:hypothetical protein GCM10025776_05080 [Corallincola platygyrae]